MAFNMTSESHGEVRVLRENDDSLLLVFGTRYEDHRGSWWNALTEYEGYTEVPYDYVNAISSRELHDEHVDRARAMRDRLDNDTAFLQWLDTLANGSRTTP